MLKGQTGHHSIHNGWFLHLGLVCTSSRLHKNITHS